MEEQIYVVNADSLKFENPPGVLFKAAHMKDWAEATSQPAKGSTLTVHKGVLLRARTPEAAALLATLAGLANPSIAPLPEKETGN
jgi:hypothetical protein